MLRTSRSPLERRVLVAIAAASWLVLLPCLSCSGGGPSGETMVAVDQPTEPWSASSFEATRAAVATVRSEIRCATDAPPDDIDADHRIGVADTPIGFFPNTFTVHADETYELDVFVDDYYQTRRPHRLMIADDNWVCGASVEPGSGALSLRFNGPDRDMVLSDLEGQPFYAVIHIASTGAPPATARPYRLAAETQPPAGLVNAYTFGRLTLTDGWALSDLGLNVTNNGGETWRNVTPFGAIRTSELQFAHGSIFFLDLQRGWVVDTYPQDASGAIDIVRTTDGGTSWQRFHVSKRAYDPNWRPTPYLVFSDAWHGWLLLKQGGNEAKHPTSIGHLFVTDDGGETWVSRPAPPIAATPYFADSRTVWLAGGVCGCELWGTRDDGFTWNRGTLGAQQNTEKLDAARTSSPVFEGSRGLVAVVSPGSGTSAPRNVTLYRSSDGGASWTPTSPLMFNAGGSTWITSADRAVVWAAQDGIYWTNDGGSTWERSDVTGVPLQWAVSNLTFVDESHGWALATCTTSYSHSTAIITTSDGGRTWQWLSFVSPAGDLHP